MDRVDPQSSIIETRSVRVGTRRALQQSSLRTRVRPERFEEILIRLKRGGFGGKAFDSKRLTTSKPSEFVGESVSRSPPHAGPFFFNLKSICTNAKFFDVWFLLTTR